MSLTNILTVLHLLMLLIITEKTYAIRIDCEDGSYVDLAACGMADSSGIVVVYYHTPSEYVNNYNLSFTHILSGYDDREDGRLLLQKGNQIIASNDDSMVGEDVDKYNVIKKDKGDRCKWKNSTC